MKFPTATANISTSFHTATTGAEWHKIGEWGVGIGDWGLGTGNWGLGVGKKNIIYAKGLLIIQYFQWWNLCLSVVQRFIRVLGQKS
ncbi:hypothetical protein [Nostoc sp. 'Peltigera malacea cyanobiont' DB3992]|uniref:hypothetical protein n=1 Tax=Nostoc sp. 'Peltigera malacea cyanobiont' DB3992 TaxID=1206980 RepID=UPI00117D4186|nr:hypothetical protein [Nostoc sp. 'Peltigera malacea cyanobiont' DB3992]